MKERRFLLNAAASFSIVAKENMEGICQKKI